MNDRARARSNRMPGQGAPWWKGVLLALSFSIACGPKADPQGEETCSSCSTPGTSSFTCTLDIDNQVADQDIVVCSSPEAELLRVACSDACLQYSATHVNACLSSSVGGPFTCHGDPTGAGPGGAVPEEVGADSTGKAPPPARDRNAQ